jgi:hypothetical protein
MRKLLSLVALLAALAGVPAFAQSGQTFPQKQYYASDYGQWSILGQAANTFTFFPIGICTVPTPSQGSFFPFNTNAPVYISDATPANSELLTPSAVTPSVANPSSSQCGITVTALNNHYSFSLKSGTAGLQEVLNQIPSNVAYPTVVWLDRNWYSAINSIAQTISTQNAAAVIASVTGTANATLVDNTTIPFTYYRWNGSKYVAASNMSSLPFNLNQTTYTSLAAPTAISTGAATYGILTTATTGGSIPASSTYRVGITYVDAAGQETTLSTDSASTATVETGSATATNTLAITSPATETGAVGYRVYVTAAGGASLSEILYSPTCTATTLQSVLPSATVCAIGSPATITAIVTGTATVPLVNTAYARTLGSSGAYAPFPALGTVATTVVGNLGTINLPAGYLNSLGKSLTMCGNGYATTNGTAGTVTLATKLASLVGTTSITPFTVISPSIAASAIQVPINFCETWTTSATGSSGTLEAHGWVDYGVAGTAVGSLAQDIIFAASSAIDLTKSDQIQFTITPTTAGLTAAQLRQLTITQSN